MCVGSVFGKVFVSGVSSFFFRGLFLYIRFLYSRAGEEFRVVSSSYLLSPSRTFIFIGAWLRRGPERLAEI